MITLDTVAQHLRTYRDHARHLVNRKSSFIGQAILLVFILSVVAYAAFKPHDCCIVQGEFIAEDVVGFHAEPSSLSIVSAPRDEDRVLVDGTTLAAQGYAEDVLWRWDERPHREVLGGWNHTSGSRNHRTEAYAYRLATLEDRSDVHAPGLLVLPHNQVTQRNQSTQTFYAREIDELRRDLRTRFSMIFEVEDGTAYLAYYPRDGGIGVEVYAVDLRTNSPLWRTTVRAVDPDAELRTQVQLHVAHGRVHVMTREGELRRIDELSAKTGEIMSLQEVRKALTQSPPRESMEASFFKMCTFTQTSAQDRRVCISAKNNVASQMPLQVVRQSMEGETLWRLTLLGDQVAFMPLERLEKNPSSDVIVSHDSGKAGSVVTAIDHDSGEVLWTTGVQVTAQQEIHHKLIETDVLRMDGEPMLVVYTEENEESYTVYLEPQTGRVLSMLRSSR